MQTELTTMQPQQAPMVQTAGDATANIATMILQAAANPQTNVDNIAKMYELYKAEAERLAELEFSKALGAMHAEIAPIATDASFAESNNNNQNQKATRYLSYEKMVAITKPILEKYGFSLYHQEKTDIAGQAQAKNGATIFNGFVTVTATLRHTTGKSLQTSLTIPFDFSGNKNSNTAQAQGSAVSYGRRYTMAGLLKIATYDDDANFNRTNELVKLMPAQARTIAEIYNGLPADKKAAFDNLLTNNGLSQITDIPKNGYNFFHTNILGIASNQLTNNQGA